MAFYLVSDADQPAYVYPFADLGIGDGFLVYSDNVLDAFHQAITHERETPGWKHGRRRNLYNSNVMFFRIA